MYIAIDRYIIEIRSLEVNEDKIVFHNLGLEFSDKSEIKIIHDEIIRNVSSCNMTIDLRSKNLPKFVSFINTNEGSLL